MNYKLPSLAVGLLVLLETPVMARQSAQVDSQRPISETQSNRDAGTAALQDGARRVADSIVPSPPPSLPNGVGEERVRDDEDASAARPTEPGQKLVAEAAQSLLLLPGIEAKARNACTCSTSRWSVRAPTPNGLAPLD